MIISDRKRFVFVHIPKCGGTSVRKLLLPYKTPHAELGGAIGDHRPLYRLEQDYPVLWEKLVRYKSFTILRRPEPRFFSCVMQRIIDFSGIASPTEAEYRRACAADAAFLSDHPNIRDWPDDYTHFIPQTEYVFSGDKQIIKRLFPLERPHSLLSYLQNELDVETPENLPRERRSEVAKLNAIRRPANYAASALRLILPGSQFERVKVMVKRIASSEFSAEHALGHADYKSFHAFARSFYAADFQLWSNVLESVDRKVITV